MEAFVNTYQEPIFFKVETKEIERDLETEFSLRREEPYKRTKYARQFMDIKNSVFEKLKIPIETTMHRVSDKEATVLRGDKLEVKILNKTKTITEIHTFKGRRVVKVVSYVDARDLRDEKPDNTLENLLEDKSPKLISSFKRRAKEIKEKYNHKFANPK